MTRIRAVLFSLLLSVSTIPAADPPKVVRESIEWLDIWVPGNEVNDQPRVLLIGDSITRSYYQGVADKLKGKAVVSRLTTSKSVGDPGLLAEVNLILSQAKFEVIHFNNGLHGWGYTEEEYQKAFPDFISTIRKGAPQAKLLWATTTPVRLAGKADQIAPRTDRVRARNTIAAEAVTKEKIPTDDLFSLALKKPEWYTGDGVHLNQKGTAALSEQVAAQITKLINATTK